jgi:serine/threonine-protein kinase
MALPNKAKIPVGTVLAGKYKITREIGRGGMAAVYEAANVDIGKRVAIKVLAQELTASAVVVERFLREARAAAAIRSPYICDIYDSGRLDDGRPFLVLELLEGESLYERMTKIRWLDIETTVTIMTQTCRGLTKAHAAQIVHRDLKPENIFLTKDEEGNLLSKILDFGLAKFYAPMESGGSPQARLTREGAVFGTPAYMSPEQVRGQGAVDHRADLWALGCIVYECFTGRTVWSTEQGVAMTFAQIANAPLPRPSQYRPDLPPAFTAWFDRALDRDISKRFQTAKEFADELAKVFFPDRAPIESASTSMPIGQLLAGMPSTPSVRIFPPAGGNGAAPHQNVAADATTEPPPEPSRPSTGVVSPPPNPVPAGLASSTGASNPVLFSQPSVPGAAPQPEPSAPTPPSGGLVAPESREGASVTITPQRSRNKRTLAFVIGGAVVATGIAAVAWTQLGGGDPPARIGTTATPTESASAPQPPTSAASASAAPSAIPSAAPHAEPPPLPAWMTTVRDGQLAVASGDLKLAAKLFKEALDKSGGHGVPRTLHDYLQVAMASGDRAPCHLTGLGRPRSYDLAAGVAKPPNAKWASIAVTPKGAVITWTDAHDGSEHAYTAVLDDALRTTGTAVDVTPEGQSVSRPELRRAGDKLVIVWGDNRGPEAGVHARLLDADGGIAGSPVAVSPNKPGAYAPGVAVAPDGSLFVAWTDDGDSDSEDLFFRKLGASLDPQGEVVRATDLIPGGSNKPRVRWPAVAVSGSTLLFAYRMEREPNHLIHALRVPLSAAGKGLEPAKRGHADRNIGEVMLLNNDRARSDGPALSCGAGGCYATWYGEGPAGGASVASIDPAKPQPLYRKKFDRAGTRPAVAVSASGQAQAVWFQAGKVLTAPVGRDGPGAPAKIARVSGDQPTPSIVAGNKSGEWYLAWLDYESGHLEPYAARVQCGK